MISLPPIVVNTRNEGPDGPLAHALRRCGLESMWCPTTTIGPPDDPRPLLDAVSRLAAFDWVAFTSARAVDAVSRRPEWRRAVEDKTVPRVAAVGDASAARLAADHVVAEVVPDGGGASALADAIIRAAADGITGARVLWPRGDLAAATFSETLERAGAIVTSPIAYRTLPANDGTLAALAEGLASPRLAAIAFCSPSSARHLAGGLGLADLSGFRGRLQVASIGPATSAELRALGLEADVEAEKPSLIALAEAIAARLRVGVGDRT